jgi:hypothetical protein
VRVYAYQCEVCKKEDREGTGWAHLQAQASGGYQSLQSAIAGSPVTATLNLSGARSLQTNHTVDLCSRNCASLWVFGS